MEKDYSLLIAALVAIVAIAGLVLYFGGSNAGALHLGLTELPRTSAQQIYVGSGNAVAAEYPGRWEHNDWCSKGCQDACSAQFDKFECNDFCRSECNYQLRHAAQILW